ncbi:MAG: ParA family protein [Pseudomonadota bacterium]
MITVIGSLKGGSGKSTLTFNLAVWLTNADLPVCLIDTDPQATLTDVVGVRSEGNYEPILAVRGSEAMDSDAVKKASETLIDIGISDMNAVRKAIRLADRMVVPVTPSQADIWSAQRFVKFVETERGDRKLPIMGFINRGDTNQAVRETTETAAALVALPGIKFIKPRLLLRTVYRRSFSEGLAVFELEPKGKGAVEFLGLAAVLYPNVLKD